MGVLYWDKPKKKLTPEQHKNSYGFEDGPTGGYQPNMSNADAKKWKAKIVGHTKGVPQVEIRKSFKGTLLLIIVNTGKGYNYKHYSTEPKPGVYGTQITKGINIHMSTNGPVQMTFAEMAELQEAIAEAQAFLKNKTWEMGA